MTKIELMPIDADKTTKELTAEVKKTIAGLDAFVVKSPDQFEYAGEVLQNLKSKQKELDERRKAITVPLDTAKKAVMDLFREPLAKLAEVENFIKSKMIAFQTEQERKAREEQAKLEEKARKEAAKLAEKAEAARAAGKEEKAQELETKAQEAQITPVVAPNTVKVEGVSFREQWYAEVVDEKLVPREYLIVDTSALNRMAQATKGKVAIAGVKILCRKIVASKSA